MSDVQDCLGVLEYSHNPALNQFLALYRSNLSSLTKGAGDAIFSQCQDPIEIVLILTSIFTIYYNITFPLFLTAADFIIFSETLMFTVGENGRQLCHNVFVINDDILEDTETYTISLTSTDTDVFINNNTASLLIIDENDGNSKFSHLKNSCLFYSIKV